MYDAAVEKVLFLLLRLVSKLGLDQVSQRRHTERCVEEVKQREGEEGGDDFLPKVV